MLCSTDKVAYNNHADAHRGVQQILRSTRKHKRKRKGPMNTYRCPVCGGWHIGHRNARPQINRFRKH